LVGIAGQNDKYKIDRNVFKWKNRDKEIKKKVSL